MGIRSPSSESRDRKSPVNGKTHVKVGPHPGFISSSNQYSSEIKVRRMWMETGCDPAREDTYRLQGVQLIDNVRIHLQLPVRTFDTACTYFHKFRLNFRDSEYQYQDAALASLFVACKVEDTIKKSKDILAAAYNVKNPEKPVAPDDKMFEAPGKVIIGLERLILETIGFDFRTRYPQKVLVKVVRTILGKASGHDFYGVAYAMCLDMYKTFIPIKKTTFTMVMAVVELTARLRGEHVGEVTAFASERRQYSRASVMETMLDLLDLYVQHHKSTKIGTVYDLNTFIDVKLHTHAELDQKSLPRHIHHCHRCEVAVPSSARDHFSAVTTTTDFSLGDVSTKRAARSQDGTMRFVFDPEAAQEERQTVKAYFDEEFEEHEVEIEEPVPPPHQRDRDGLRGGRGGYRGGHRDWGGEHRRGSYGGGGGGHRGDRSYRGRGRLH